MRVNKDWLECYTCGGRLERNTEGVYVCECCGNTYRDIKRAEAKTPAHIVELLNSADFARKMHHFDKALEIYDSAIGQDNKNLLAYWGAFLSEYGIEYVKDGGDYVPRIHLISRLPATQSEYLQKIYKLCDETESAEYRAKAAVIEQLRNRAYELSLTQEKYDVFICGGEEPYEAKAAGELYDELKNTGVKVFMPSKSIPYAAPSAESCIFAASESAAVMFVVASSMETLERNDYVWGRFIAGDNKRIQVIHAGLNESGFPAKLREKTVRRRESISLNDIGWLEKAKCFLKTEEDKKPAVQQSTQIITEHIFMQGGKAESLAEAMTLVLSSAAAGNPEVAKQIRYSQFGQFEGNEELTPMAILCTELAALSKCPTGERAEHMDAVRFAGGEIKQKYPKLTAKEREVYGSITSAELLMYLAKCFGVIKDRERQCFALDMIDYHNIPSTKMVTELVQMLLTNGRTDEVGEVMRGVSRLDGNALLLSFLKTYAGDSVHKQMILYAVADKLELNAAVSDDLNAYLSECEDEGVALAVVNIMNGRKLRLDALGLGGALSGIKDADSARTVLDNFGKRPLLPVEVDKLVSLAANGGNDVANEVLKHLRYQTGIFDLGAYNMQTILENCDLEKIKIAFFDFNIDKKLAGELLVGVINGNGADRLATVSVLIGNVSNIDIKNYEQLLLGGDPLKKQFMKLLAPKTGKYSDANKQIEAFLCGKDSDADKREIFAMFGEFPFSKRSIQLYLDILPEAFDETYIRYLYPYIEENPAEARRLFVKHYEALIEGYERHLERIFSLVRSYDDVGICRFITEFRGSQDVKDSLVAQIVDFSDKPKKIEAVYKHVQCNLLQAYLLTAAKYTQKTESAVQYLRKKGMDAGDKVFVNGKKVKFKDYLQSGEIEKSTVDLITTHIKL